MNDPSPPPSPPTPGNYFPAVDGLRAVAVLAVIVFHLRPGLLRGGFAGVDLFFVISGFVVTGSLARRRFDSVRELLGYFYARRIVRILPALLVMLLVVTPLARAVVRKEGVEITGALVVPAFFGFSNVVLARSNAAYFAPQAEFSPFLHTWTLGVEEQFYLVFPFFFYFFLRGGFTHRDQNRRALRVAVAGCAASFVLCALLSRGGGRYAFYLMPPRLWELGTGVVLCLTMHRWQPALARARGKTAALAAGVLAGTLGLFFLGAPERFFPFPTAVVPVAAGAGLIALGCARPLSLVSRTLSHPAAVLAGRMSYSLYLWHWPVFSLFRWTVGVDGARTALAALALSCAAAAGSYFVVEQPLRRSRWVKGLPRRTVLAFGASAAVTGAAVAVGVMFALPKLLPPVARHAFWHGGPTTGGCRVTASDMDFSGGTMRSWVPECGVSASRGTLWVVGDSHAAQYGKLLSRYAAEHGTPVTMYFHFGCGVPRLSRPEAPQCGSFERRVSAELSGKMKKGDLLFLPALRIPRFKASSWTSSPAPRPVLSAEQRGRVYREGVALLLPLAATGAQLVIEAPKPIFPSPVFRCVEWFNRNNPACRDGFHAEREELLALRAPVAAAMHRLASDVPNLAVWDPFPILCPGSPCSAFRDGKPLVVDQDHISGHANDLLYPSFVRMTERTGFLRVSPSAERRAPGRRSDASGRRE